MPNDRYLSRMNIVQQQCIIILLLASNIYPKKERKKSSHAQSVRPCSICIMNRAATETDKYFALCVQWEWQTYTKYQPVYLLHNFHASLSWKQRFPA